MAIGSAQRYAVDQCLKAMRVKATALRTMVWREGATTDPKAVLTGMDMIFELAVEMESLLAEERLANQRPNRKTP